MIKSVFAKSLLGLAMAAGLLTMSREASAAMSENPGYPSYINTTVNNTYPNYITQDVTGFPWFPSSNITVGNSYARVESAAFDANTGFSFTTSQQYDASTGNANKSWVSGYLNITVDVPTTVVYIASIGLSTTGTRANSSLAFGIMDSQTNAYYAYQAITNQSGNKTINYTLQPNVAYKVFFSELIDPKTGASGLTTANTSFSFALGTGNIPEPATVGILGTAAAALLMRRRK